jgi:hypothetical protein
MSPFHIAGAAKTLKYSSLHHSTWPQIVHQDEILYDSVLAFEPAWSLAYLWVIIPDQSKPIDYLT